MQFKGTLATLLAVASLASAQDISSLPSCATAGALAAITSSGCSTTDTACICKSQSFTNSLEQYAKANCSPEDYNKAVTVGQSLCASAGVTVDAASATTTTTSAGSMTADPNATMTSMAMNATETESATHCECEDDMPTAEGAAPVATFTGAAVGGFGCRPVVVAGLVGVLGLLALGL